MNKIFVINVPFIVKLLKENKELCGIPFQAFTECVLFYGKLNENGGHFKIKL